MARSVEILSSPSTWAVLIILEVMVGIISFILPSYMAIGLVVGVPVIILLIRYYFYAYLLGVFLIPVWAITLTGGVEMEGQVDIRFSDVLFILAFFGWALERILQSKARRADPVNGSYLDVWLIPFFFWIFLSIWWSPSLGVGIKEFLRKFNCLFAFYLTINVVKDEKKLFAIIATWITSGFLTGLGSIAQFLVVILERAAGLGGGTSRWGWLRATALKEGANRLGFFMNTTMLLAMAQYFLSTKKWLKVILPIGIVCCLCALLATLSRNSIMGFIVGSTILFFITRKGGKRFLFTAAAIAVVFLTVSGPEYRELFFARLGGIVDPGETASIEGRSVIWAAAFRMVADRPILGAGAGGVHVLSESYGAGHLKSPHDLYIYVTAEFGFVGLLLFLSVVWTFFLAIFRRLKTVSNETERSILASLIATICLYGFQGLVLNFTLIEREFWVLLGLNMAALRIYRDDREDDGPDFLTERQRLSANW